MSDGQFEREAMFLTGMDFFRSMFMKGIINEEEYRELLRRLAEKYDPPLGVLPLTD